jgi:protein-tyrosine-phosphatase
VPAFNVLFLGTRNAARSIIAEALLRKLGGARFTAWSAGAQPARQPMPEVLGRLSRLGCDVAPLRCKPWDTFTGRDAPRIDFVLVLGDAGRGRPWPELRPDCGDKPIVAAWPLPDPNAYKGALAERAVLLDELLGMVRRRLTPRHSMIPLRVKEEGAEDHRRMSAEFRVIKPRPDQASCHVRGPRKAILPMSTPLWRRIAYAVERWK